MKFKMPQGITIIPSDLALGEGRGGRGRALKKTYFPLEIFTAYRQKRDL